MASWSVSAEQIFRLADRTTLVVPLAGSQASIETRLLERASVSTGDEAGRNKQARHAARHILLRVSHTYSHHGDASTGDSGCNSDVVLS